MKRADILKYSGGLPAYREHLSWAIFTAVTLLGEADWRKFIFCQFNNCSQISFATHSFKGNYKFTTLIKYLNKKSKKRYRYFTITDPTQYGTDTHFISFIVDSKSKVIYFLNPAIGSRGLCGTIDDPFYYESEKVVHKFFLDKKYHIIYYPMSCACQCTEDDVYCQSWSLITSIKAYPQILAAAARREEALQGRHGARARADAQRGGPLKVPPLKIPSKKELRFNYILEFWKSLLKNPDFCAKLQVQYKVLRGNKGVINPENKNEACELLKYSIAKDML